VALRALKIATVSALKNSPMRALKGVWIPGNALNLPKRAF